MDVVPARVLKPLDRELFEWDFGDRGPMIWASVRRKWAGGDYP